MSLIDDMIKAGININNFQEVFDFVLHSEGIGRTEFDLVMKEMGQSLDAIQKDLSSKISLDNLEEKLQTKLDKASYEQQGGGGTAASTDQITEGQLNLYFSAERVLSTLLMDLVIPESAESIQSTDSIVVALGKVQAQLTAVINNSDSGHAGASGSVHFLSVNAAESNGNYNNDGATGLNAVAIGPGTQAIAEGSISIGEASLSSIDHGIAVGSGSSTGGSRAIAIGQSSNASKNYSTALGFGALASGVGSQAFGTTANASSHYCVSLGYGASVTGNYQIQLGNTSTTTYAFGAVQDRSDVRDKTDIQDVDLGLDFINRLRPVKYRWDYRDDYAREMFPMPNRLDFEDDESFDNAYQLNQQARIAFFATPVKDGSKVRKRYHHGLIAQELKQVLDEMGVDHAAYQDHATSDGLDVKSIGYSELIPNLIKAIQELSKEVSDLKMKVS